MEYRTDSPTAAPGSLFYKPKTAPFYFGPLINACQNGDLEKVKSLWRPYLLRLCNELGRDETCHPLLVASHHLKVDVVDFLLQQGLNPRQRGTVHPYAGDLLTVSELQGITPVELTNKQLFMHPRKSKRRDALLAIHALLQTAVVEGDNNSQRNAALLQAADADEAAWNEAFPGAVAAGEVATSSAVAGPGLEGGALSDVPPMVTMKAGFLPYTPGPSSSTPAGSSSNGTAGSAFTATAFSAATAASASSSSSSSSLSVGAVSPALFPELGGVSTGSGSGSGSGVPGEAMAGVGKKRRRPASSGPGINSGPSAAAGSGTGANGSSSSKKASKPLSSQGSSTALLQHAAGRGGGSASSVAGSEDSDSVCAANPNPRPSTKRAKTSSSTHKGVFASSSSAAFSVGAEEGGEASEGYSGDEAVAMAVAGLQRNSTFSLPASSSLLKVSGNASSKGSSSGGAKSEPASSAASSFLRSSFASALASATTASAAAAECLAADLHVPHSSFAQVVASPASSTFEKAIAMDAQTALQESIVTYVAGLVAAGKDETSRVLPVLLIGLPEAALHLPATVTSGAAAGSSHKTSLALFRAADPAELANVAFAHRYKNYALSSVRSRRASPSAADASSSFVQADVVALRAVKASLTAGDEAAAGPAVAPVSSPHLSGAHEPAAAVFATSAKGQNTGHRDDLKGRADALDLGRLFSSSFSAGVAVACQALPLASYIVPSTVSFLRSALALHLANLRRRRQVAPSDQGQESSSEEGGLFSSFPLQQIRLNEAVEADPDCRVQAAVGFKAVADYARAILEHVPWASRSRIVLLVQRRQADTGSFPAFVNVPSEDRHEEGADAASATLQRVPFTPGDKAAVLATAQDLWAAALSSSLRAASSVSSSTTLVGVTVHTLPFSKQALEAQRTFVGSSREYVLVALDYCCSDLKKGSHAELAS